MKKVIVIDLDSKYEYVNKYDDDRINEGLHQYILDSFDDLKQDVVLKVKFNYDISDEDRANAEKMFNMSFAEKFNNTESELKKLRFKDVILMVLGFVFLAIYCLLDRFNVFLFSEFFLVISWVAFWETVEGWLFSVRKLKVVKMKYQKLLSAEIEIVD